MTEKLETANKQKKKKSYMVLSKIIMLATFYLFMHTETYKQKSMILCIFFYSLFSSNSILS